MTDNELNNIIPEPTPESSLIQAPVAIFVEAKHDMIQHEIKAVQLQRLMQDMLGHKRIDALVTVKFGWIMQPPNPIGKPVYHVYMGKKRGTAQEYWAFAFAMECLNNCLTLEKAVKRFMKSFENAERAHGISNSPIKPTGV